MNNSQSDPQDLFFTQKPANLAPLEIPKDNSKDGKNDSLFFENMSGSLPQLKSNMLGSIVSPDNPLRNIANHNIEDNLSLGISPQIPQSQLKSPVLQFKFQGLSLQQANSQSHNFEDSIDLKSQNNNESPTIQPLPNLKNDVLADLSALNKDVNVGQSAQLRGSGILTQSLTAKGMKDSAFMIQSPNLEALEEYITKAKEEEQKKGVDFTQNSRPGSGEPFIEQNHVKEKKKEETSPLKSPKKSPLKKWQKKMEEERMALIESMIREEEEKKEYDEEFKKNDEEINSYDRKIEEEIKSGTLKRAKTVEKENHIVEFKRVYHKLFVFSGFLKNIYRKYLFVNLICDQIFRKFCSYFKGRLMISKYLMIIAFMFSIVMIGYILGTDDVEYKTRSRTYHQLKKYMANNLVKAALITTYYGVFFVQIRYNILIVLLFFVQFLPCFIILMRLAMDFYVSKTIHDLPPDDFLNTVFFASLYLFWLLVFFVKEDVKRNFSETKKMIFVIIWFVFGGSIFAGVTVYQIAISRKIDVQWYHDYIATLCVPYVIFICINWVYLHVRFIVPIPKRSRHKKLTTIPSQNQNNLDKNVIEKQKSHFATIKTLSARKLLPKKSFGDFLNVSEISKENLGKKANLYKMIVLFFENFLKKFSRFLISIASFSTFGAIISTTIYCLYYILYETNENLIDPVGHPLNSNAVVCCSLLVLAIPIMFLIGIPLIASNVDLKNKLFLFPIFGLVIPICITLPIANAIESYKEYETFTSFLIFGPPCMSIFWLFLIYMSQHGRRILYFVTTFFCLFFVVPLGFLSPLLNAEGFFNSDGAKAALIILLTIGSAIVFIYLLYLFLRRFGQRYLMSKEELAKQPKFELLNYFRLNCEIFGLFGNGVGFIVTITILIYGIFNKPDYIRPSQDGSLSGLIIVVCLLFVFLTLIIRMPVQNPSKQFTHSINDRFEKGFEEERSKIIKTQGIVRLLVLIFGLIIVPIIFIPIIVVERDNQESQYLLLTALIGIILIVFIFQLFFSIKKDNEQYAKSLVPSLSIFCWFFVFIPFLAILPITVVNLRLEEDIASLYKITVGVAALIIFLGVGILAVIGNLFFKRIEFEKKFKFVAGKVIKMLKKQHVRSDYDVIRLAYENYLTNGPNKSEESMKKAKPIYYVKTSKYNPQIEYSKILISEANYMKLKKKQAQTQGDLENELKKNKKGNKCLKFLLNTCCPFEEFAQNSDRNRLHPQRSEEFLNTNILKETEEEVLSNDSDEDQIYEHKKTIKPQKTKEAELGEAFNDILMNNVDKNNENLASENLSPEVQLLKNLKARDLDPRIWTALKFYDFTDNLGVNEKAQFDLLKVVFGMFAFGDKKMISMPWIDYICFKEFLRLSRIIPCEEIPDFLIDLAYTQFTTKDSTDFCNPILEYNFKELLMKVAMLRFPDDIKEDAFNKLLRYYIFPLILWNMPEMQLHYPHEWDYVLFLMKLYGLDDNLDETRAMLQRKIDNEKLMKQMAGMMLLEKEEEELRKKKEEEERLLQLELEKQLAEEAERKRLQEEIRLKKQKEEEEARLAEERIQEELRQKKLEIEKQKKLEKERKERERRRIMKYWLCIKINELCVFFFQSFCLIQTKGVLEEEMEGEKNEDEADFHYAVDQLIAISNKKRTFNHLESPPWPDVVHSMVDFFPLAEEEYLKKKMKEESLHLQKNLTNFMAIISKIIEMYSMGSIALRPQINWDLSPNAQTVLNALNNNIPLSDFPKYKFFFWLSFGISVLYWFIGYQSVKRIKSGVFGIVSGSKSKFNKDFLCNAFVNIASSSMYMIIMKSFIDTFSCNYDVKPWTLYEDPTIICNDQTHYIYVFFASIGILLYYPLSSFLFPNIQFQNKALDLKYDPTFVVILTQIKLLISGTASFFPVGNGLIIQLTVSTIAIMLLAFIDKIMKPCMIKRHNILEVGGYLIAAWMCLSGLINVSTGDAFAATIIIIIGPIIIALMTIFFYVRHIIKMKKLREEHKAKKSLFGHAEVQSPEISPSGSPISISSKNKQNENYDFSKKVNQFDDFSISSSPLSKSPGKKAEFRIDMKEVRKEEEEENATKQLKAPNNVLDEEEKE